MVDIRHLYNYIAPSVNMAGGSFQQLPWFVSQEEVREPSIIASAPALSYSEQNSPSSRPPQRRQSSFPASPNRSPVEKSKGAVRRRSNPKAASSNSREGPARASSGIMNDPASEITYTPTTHRISKAKKGKKVHACEYPGCTKVGIIAPGLSRKKRSLTGILDLHESRAPKVRWKMAASVWSGTIDCANRSY